MNDLQLFMYLYMYELELWLNEHKGEILSIQFQSDEANTDRPLKEFLRNIVEKNQCNGLVKLKDISVIMIDGKSYNVTELIKQMRVDKILLKEDITDQIKDILKSRKNAIYTQPDLCLVIHMNGKIEYETVELKSTKSDAIPGSSVQQILPDEWVIFVKHNQVNVEVTTGKYFYSINSKMQFPDRSPRPQVSFGELQRWNKQCRHETENIITYTSTGDEKERYRLLSDWQGVLAERWTEIVFSYNPKKNDPWFNNNLRKFVLNFLERYDNMSDEEKKQYKNSLLKIIK